MEWTVVTALVVVVGLFVTVGKPVLALNANIVELNMSIKALREKQDEQELVLKEQRNHAHESHKRLWEHNAEQDKQLGDHEKRLDVLERKE